MKRVIFVSGEIGSGKTTVSRSLATILNRAIMFDMDWLMFQGDGSWSFSEDVKKMASKNLSECLGNAHQSSEFDIAIISAVSKDWIIHVIEDFCAHNDLQIDAVRLCVDDRTLRARRNGRMLEKRAGVDPSIKIAPGCFNLRVDWDNLSTLSYAPLVIDANDTSALNCAINIAEHLKLPHISKESIAITY